MSKSLKNFIRIRSILGNVSPRVLRIFFNLKNYDQILNYNPEDDFI
jgi:cysteinyl-tRNA synthetase